MALNTHIGKKILTAGYYNLCIKGLLNKQLLYRCDSKNDCPLVQVCLLCTLCVCVCVCSLLTSPNLYANGWV